MKKEKISEIISQIDEKYIGESADFAERNASRRAGSVKFKWSVAAACIAIIAVIGSASFVLAAEAKEYNTALTFFEENGLSTDGLSRSEVKAVYRDISTKSFTYSKTAKVIEQNVSGWEIMQDEPTPEELAELWDKSILANSISEKGISYKRDWIYKRDESLGFDVFDKVILKCFKDGESLWTAEFTNFDADGSAYTSHGTAVWGSDSILSGQYNTYAWLAEVDDNGNILWEKKLDHGFKYEYISSVLDNGDGTWAVIGTGDFRYLCFGRYDMDGNELYFKKTEMDRFAIRNTALLGDGYIVQTQSITTESGTVLLKLDRDGNIAGNFRYESEDCDYYITDMVEFGGRIYLSAYSVPKQKDAGGRDEIANILRRLFPDQGGVIGNVDDEELAQMLKDNYTAVLLLCDTDSGIPQNFYSVKSSLGGKLSVNDEGQLEWDVENIISAFFSPFTSSFTIGGTCKVFRYTFDGSGNITAQTDTEETVPYRR